MQGRNKYVAFLFLAVAACASGPKYSGNTVADSRLKADTSMFVIGPTLAQANCKQVDSISTSILSVDKDMKGNKAGKIVSGDNVERWVASACGKTVSFIVTFSPDGQGGSYMAVKPEK